MTTAGTDDNTPYARMGGAAFFDDLVHEFYLGVAQDPPLRALYPDADLLPAQGRLRMFLEQYWGGPTTYQQQRGHPRLRLRHADYRIDLAQRDRWVLHMTSALRVVGARHDLDPELAEQLRAYLTSAADALVNAAPS